MYFFFQHAGDLGRQWGQRSVQAASASTNYWWERYEEFVGLNEVREAQTKVTEVSRHDEARKGLESKMFFVYMLNEARIND